jgi:AcrR family transcriptional regulator
MQAQRSKRTNPPDTRWRIIKTATQLYRRIGHQKTTVADIAREMSMSPASVYRFFRSKQAISEAVVGELLEEILLAASNAARNGGSAIQRLHAAFQVINRIHAYRSTNENRLHELIVTATHENWSVTNSYNDRITQIVSQVVAAGQVQGELRNGDSITLTRCLLAAMDTHLNPMLIPARVARPTPAQLIDFCISALRVAPRSSEPSASDRIHHFELTEDLFETAGLRLPHIANLKPGTTVRWLPASATRQPVPVATDAGRTSPEGNRSGPCKRRSGLAVVSLSPICFASR